MIKIRLEKWECALVMQVLEQDKDLCQNIDFKSSNGFSLRSSSCPAFWKSDNILFVRGHNQETEWSVISICFKTNTERNILYNNIIQLFNEYNTRDQEKEPEEKNIFILR